MAVSVKNSSSANHSRDDCKSTKQRNTATGMTHDAPNTAEVKHLSSSAQAKPLNVGASYKPKTVKVCGINLPDAAIKKTKLFLTLAGRISRWKELAHFLKFSEEHIDYIDTTYGYENEKCFQMLCSWQKREGNRATYIQLAKGFKFVKQEYLIEELDCYLQSSVAEAVPGASYEEEMDLSSDSSLGKFNRNFHQFISKGKDSGFSTASIQVTLKKK